MAGFWTRALGAAAVLCASEIDAGSLDWKPSSSGTFDYGQLENLPANFGTGEFTLELWIRPNTSFSVGPTNSGAEQLSNWSSEDLAPYSSNEWWYHGNFLLDGHNNAGSNFQNGTFSLQLYGGGRVRWLFGDGESNGQAGSLWAVQASPATSTPSLLDGAWHFIALVRRFTGSTQSTLELWVDGALVDTQVSSARTNMATAYWNNWTGFAANQRGWFWGSEKLAAIGDAPQWEDYKGLLDEVRFWSRAKNTSELGPVQFANPVTGSETGLVGWYDFNEGAGASTCSSIVASQCISLVRATNDWNAGEAPTTGSGGDITAPTVPQNVNATPASATTVNLTWDASTDAGTGVASYRVRRDGATVALSVAGTNYSDVGLTQNTTYNYTVSAVDVAGNRSAESSAAQATTPVAPADTIAPSTPTNFAASATSSTNIALSWTASTDNVGVANYEVRRDGTLIGSPTGVSFNDSGRTASTTYSYTILAVDAAGNTSATASASATTRAASSSSSSSGGGGGGGGRFDILTLFAALTLLSIQVQRRKRPTVLDRAA
jgi:chitodextrinase